MSVLDKLNVVLAENRSIHLLEEGIYSALSNQSRSHHYDKRAAIYDVVVGTRLYNQVMWGSSTRDYVAFARRALLSYPRGLMLDAGCGSLLFTAGAYCESGRQIIAIDQSSAMLKRARRRLIGLTGRVPEHILLLQSDLTDLPFRAFSFSSILCMNVLHQFVDAAGLIHNLSKLLAAEGRLRVTSLVMNNRFPGDRYLSTLHALGEFVRPRRSLDLETLLSQSPGQRLVYRTTGNMAYATFETNHGAIQDT